MNLALLTLICFLPALSQGRPNKLDTKLLLKDYSEKHPNQGDDLECEILGDTEGEIGPLNAIVEHCKKWTYNILYYDIADPNYSEEQISQIRSAVKEIEDKTSVNGEKCIIFKESDTARNRVTVLNCGYGCSSYVGMIGGSQRMCLAPECFRGNRAILHEFLHALGFHHEHVREDRDEYVYINYANIIRGKEIHFHKQSMDYFGTKYDYGSVMHYPAHAFAIDRSIPTIIPLDPEATIGQGVSLSSTDIERIQIFYGCKDAAGSVHFKHLAGKI